MIVKLLLKIPYGTQKINNKAVMLAVTKLEKLDKEDNMNKVNK